MTYPPAAVFWFLAHPFAATWRRLGPRISYAVLFSAMALVGLGTYLVRAPLLAVDFGTQTWTFWAGIAVWSLAGFFEIQCRKHLKFRTLVGAPELVAGGESPGPAQKLLQDGIYAHVRHPRYVAICLGLLAFSLIANHLAPYLLVPPFVVAIYGVTLLEERELVQRFGEEYEEYRRRVPRLWPRLREQRRTR